MNKKILLLGIIVMIIIFTTGCFSILPTIGLASVDEIDKRYRQRKLAGSLH